MRDHVHPAIISQAKVLMIIHLQAGIEKHDLRLLGQLTQQPGSNRTILCGIGKGAITIELDGDVILRQLSIQHPALESRKALKGRTGVY